LSIIIVSCKTIKHKTIPAQQPVSLFNGKNLQGCTIHGTEKWYVENGVLICKNG
jgi:hypothetical protein